MAMNLTTVNGAPLPPGTYYFSRISDTDHAGYVWIVALLSLIYPFGTLLVRLNVRWVSDQKSRRQWTDCITKQVGFVWF